MRKLIYVMMLVIVIVVNVFANSWESSVTSDPFTGEPVVYVTTMSIDGALTIFNANRSLYVSILWSFHNPDPSYYYSVRFDGGELYILNLDSGDSMSSVSYEDRIKFVDILMYSENIIIEVSQYPDGRLSEKVAEFNVSGLKSALKPYMKEFGLE